MTMPYTLAMAAEQGISIADDGVAEVSMTYARANLTQLLRDVRYGKRPGAFTERSARSAYVVPPEFYEQALRDRAIIDELHRRTDPGGGSSAYEEGKARTIREALHDAALAVDD